MPSRPTPTNAYERSTSFLTRTVLTLLVLSSLPAVAAPAAPRELTSYVWDLSSLYTGHEAFEAERAVVLETLAAMAQRRDEPIGNAKEAAERLDELSGLRARAAKMVVYAALLSETNTRSAEATSMSDVAINIEAHVESEASFVEERLRDLGEPRLRSWLEAEPRLARHRTRVVRILREAPFTPRGETQAAIATMARWPLLCGDAYQQFLDSDLGWPSVLTSAGTTARADSAAYARYASSPDAGDRERISSGYLSTLRKFEEPFGLLLERRIDADLEIARLRGFERGADAIWFLRDGVPLGGQRVMLDVARANVATLQRYARLRGRATGAVPVSYGGLAVPPPAISRSFPITDAIDAAVESSAPLGAAYQSRLRKRITEERWMDLAPRQDKRATYAIFPPVGGANPYFMMSYRNDYNSSRSFAGGVMLMMSFAGVPRELAPETRDDPGIYSNAMIYVGRLLHDDYRARTASSRGERAAVLVQELDILARTYFRWAIVSELEAWIEEAVRNGSPPDGKAISAKYLQLLRRDYGHENRITSVGDVWAGEWMTFPVPFSTYEHQFWPPSIAAACALLERTDDGTALLQKAVTELFRRGEDDRSYGMFRSIGIDLATPTPYEAVIRRMNRIMNELEPLLEPGQS